MIAYMGPTLCDCTCGCCRCQGTTSVRQTVITSYRESSEVMYVPSAALSNKMNRHERRRYAATGKLPDAKNFKPHWRR